MIQHVSKYSLVYLAAAMLWLKTYFVQKFNFDLPVSNWYQELILLVNPISSACLLLAVGFFISKKRRNLSIIVVSLFSSLLLISNVIYYRFYHDFITLPVLFQGKNLGDLGGSITGSVHMWDIWMFFDFFILLYLVYVKKKPEIIIQRKQLVRMFTTGLVIFLVTWGMAEIARPGVMIKSFDRHTLVRSIGTYNYHLHDIVLNSRMQTKKVLAKSTDAEAAETFMEEIIPEETRSSLFGLAEGKNVFLISMESLHDFVIGRSIENQEITPFLNDLIEESYYAPDFYHQTGQGKTSDSEFIIDNALYPLPSGAVYFTHADNTYLSTPKILKEHGYYSAVFHANDRTFWNRETMYESMGYDRFIAKDKYVVNEENSIGWGLKDMEFFEQSMLHLKYLPQPFYSKFITLTNHHPFDLSEADQLIPAYNSDSDLVNGYFQTVRYMDESIKVFFEKIKEQGLYENSIFILYGDHYGISPYYYPAISEFLGKEEITPLEHVQLQKVPLIIHIPGQEAATIDVVSGQVDIRPTLLNLLGIEVEDGLYFGQDMLSAEKESFAVLRDGSFITEDHVYTEDACYLKSSGEKVEDSECDTFRERAEKELEYSDEIIYGDLLRFKEEDE